MSESMNRALQVSVAPWKRRWVAGLHHLSEPWISLHQKGSGPSPEQPVRVVHRLAPMAGESSPGGLSLCAPEKRLSTGVKTYSAAGVLSPPPPAPLTFPAGGSGPGPGDPLLERGGLPFCCWQTMKDSCCWETSLLCLLLQRAKKCCHRYLSSRGTFHGREQNVREV